jgi:hypothetical protein
MKDEPFGDHSAGEGQRRADHRHARSVLRGDVCSVPHGFAS